MRVRLTPKSSLDAVGEISQTADGPALAARVRAVPSGGDANVALVRLMAGWLGVPIRSVRVSAGAKSRVKMLTIDGDGEALGLRIATKLKPEPA